VNLVARQGAAINVKANVAIKVGKLVLYLAKTQLGRRRPVKSKSRNAPHTLDQQTYRTHTHIARYRAGTPPFGHVIKPSGKVFTPKAFNDLFAAVTRNFDRFDSRGLCHLSSTSISR